MSQVSLLNWVELHIFWGTKTTKKDHKFTFLSTSNPRKSYQSHKECVEISHKCDSRELQGHPNNMQLDQAAKQCTTGLTENVLYFPFFLFLSNQTNQKPTSTSEFDTETGKFSFLWLRIQQFKFLREKGNKINTYSASTVVDHSRLRVIKNKENSRILSKEKHTYQQFDLASCDLAHKDRDLA